MAYRFFRNSNLLIDGFDIHFDNFGGFRPMASGENFGLSPNFDFLAVQIFVESNVFINKNINSEV